MYKIGEKLNSSVPGTLAAMQRGDTETLEALILSQAAAGADCLDINTALCGADETALLCRIAAAVAEKTGCDIMLDSPAPQAIIAALPHTCGRYTIINSITADERLELLPAAAEYAAGVVGLPIGGGAIPRTAEGRLANAVRICESCAAAGIPESRIYIDALAEAVAVEPGAGRLTLDTVRLLRRELPEVHILCGLSNVSFGLPARAKLNAAAAAMLCAAGMDCAIFDVASSAVSDSLAAAAAFTGSDEYCMEYIDHMRCRR